MRATIRTVLFHATGESHWKRVVAMTGLQLLRATPGLRRAGLLRRAGDRPALQDEFQVLSYLNDWKDAFCRAPSLEVTCCDINNLVEYRAGLRLARDCPLVVVLHSAAWDSMTLLRLGTRSLRRRRGTMLVLFGDEYHHLAQKTGFARAVTAEYIGTQLPLPAASWLYKECTASEILPAPHALNPDVFTPGPGARPVDIGFRGAQYVSALLGDASRNEVVERVGSRARELGLVTDVQYQRVPREHWAAFLNSCKGVVGAESGTPYLEKDDRTRRAVGRYLRKNPGATFDDVHQRFFKHYPNPVSGKAISSRHFEPIGTKTCQLLLEGQYNGLLKADEHYIPVKPDYSNLDEALRQFRDAGYRRRIADQAYDYVRAHHTYTHRIQELLRALNL